MSYVAYFCNSKDFKEIDSKRLGLAVCAVGIGLGLAEKQIFRIYFFAIKPHKVLNVSAWIV